MPLTATPLLPDPALNDPAAPSNRGLAARSLLSALSEPGPLTPEFLDRRLKDIPPYSVAFATVASAVREINAHVESAVVRDGCRAPRPSVLLPYIIGSQRRNLLAAARFFETILNTADEPISLRLYASRRPDVEIRLSLFAPDLYTPPHDHKGRVGAFAVIDGAIFEEIQRVPPLTRRRTVGETRLLPADMSHRCGGARGIVLGVYSGADRP